MGSPAASKSMAASLVVVRQALQRALLQDNLDFWRQNRPDPKKMDQQDVKRRNRLALQLFLRLHILVATHGVYSDASCAIRCFWEPA